MRIVGSVALSLVIGCAGGPKDAGTPGDTEPPTTATLTGTPTGSGGTTAPIACPETVFPPFLEAATGCYLGRADDGVEAFLGIRYAQPPVGDLRWARPVPIAPESGPITARDIGSACIQSNGTLDFELAAGDGDEDCLFLNVLRPEGTAPGAGLPIAFFVHGGGHVDGHGGAASMIGASFHAPEADPPLLPEGPDLVSAHDLIVVTINYRLAQLGWTALPGLSAENADGASGNQGLWDTLLALQWVRDNAAAIGGDPDRILLFGESAGSVSTCALLASPLADGMFAAALLQSGTCTHLVAGLDTAPPLVETAYEQGQRLAEALGCDTAGDDAAVVACLRALPATEVMSVMQGQLSAIDLGDETYGPTLDGVLLPDPPADRFAAGQVPPVPVVVGVNADEGTLFTTLAPIGNQAAFDLLLNTVALLLNWDAPGLRALYDPAGYGGDVEAAYAAFYGDLAFVCPARELAATLALHTDTHAYHWTWPSPILGFLGAHHGVEIPYVFGTGLGFGDQGVMRDVAGSTWASVAGGAPAVPDVGPWPQFGALDPDGGTWVELTTTPSVLATGPRKAECDWMAAQPGW